MIEFDYRKMFIHVSVALFFGGVLIDLGSIMKFVFLPYLLYLLFQRRVEHIFAIMIIMSFGTVLTVLMGFLLIPYCYIHRDKLNDRFWHWLYNVLLIMAPFYIIATVNRMLNGMDFIEAIIMNDYYVAFWFLLFGVVNKEFFNIRFLKLFLRFGIILSFFIALFKDLGSFESLVRISNYFDLVLMILVINNLFSTRIKLRNIWVMIFFLVLRNAIFGIEYKFTFIFGLILAVLAWRFWRSENPIGSDILLIRGKSFPRFIMLMPFIFLMTTLYLTPIYATKYVDVDVDYSLDRDIVDQILFKLFVDRGVLWMGALDGIESHTGFLLPYEDWNIVYTDVNNNKFEVDYESHNLILGLIKYNGYLFGPILIFVYMSVMFRLYLAQSSFRNMHGIYTVAFFGLGIAVFITGQYILQLSTSFLFMSLVGGLISCSKLIKTNYLEQIK